MLKRRRELGGVRRLAWRSRVALGALGVLAGSCSLDECSPTYATLSFYSQERSGTLLDRKVVGAGRGVAFGEDALSGGLTTRSLEEVRVEYKATRSRTEAVLFAVDPARHYDALQSTALLRDDDEGWEELTALTWPLDCFDHGPCNRHPAPKPPKATWPNAVVIPNPSPDAYDTGNIVALDSTDFWLNSPPTGPIATPAPAGAVRAAFVYDHGVCSRSEPVAGQLWEGLVDAWKRSVAQLGAQAPVDALAREWMNAATWLSHDDEPGSDIVGGFLIDSRMLIETGFYLNDILVDTAASYTFGLSHDGFLEVAGEPILVEANGVDLLAPSLTPELGSLLWLIVRILVDPAAEASTQLGGVATSVNATLRSKQTIRPVPFDEECTGDVHGHIEGCSSSKVTLAGAIVQGASYLNGAAAATLSSADMTAMQLAALERWTCQSQGKVTDPRICGPALTCDRPSLCRFTVPAKRVNVYPDEVELVWFDGKEVDNAAYALWVAAHANPKSRSSLSQLCAWQEPPPVYGDTWQASKFRRRQFVSLSLGGDYVDF